MVEIPFMKMMRARTRVLDSEKGQILGSNEPWQEPRPW